MRDGGGDMRTPWIVIHDGTQPGTRPMEHACLRCGERFHLSLPISVRVFVAASTAFLAQHRHCPEPTP